ncbi:MAG: hypothetical protein C4B58_04835 [Deltaproteobacteria bacterium]|nr:MAG: hypothetical protein C4B58_04835 [Deltaproteobacteria bacterium]
MDSAGRSWEEIFREVSLRAKEFSSYKGEAEILPKGVILDTSLEQIEGEFEALSKALSEAKEKAEWLAKAKEKSKWLGENWYWVFLPLIEKIIDQICWICLGLFEYEGLQEKPHWLYFTTTDYINNILPTFSLIGRTDFFDKNLQENVILSFPFYQEVQEKKLENERNARKSEISKTLPFCIRLENIELPKRWQQEDSKFAAVADWHDAFSELENLENSKVRTYNVTRQAQNRLIDFLNEEVFDTFAEKEYLPKLFVRGKKVANKIPSHFKNSDITQYKERIGNYLAMMHDSSKGEASLILTIPSWRPPGEKRRFRSVALIACFKKPQPDAALPLEAVTTAMELGSSNISLFVFGFLNKELKKHATKSAIAAIISRNMSHNIGSHVLAKISSRGAENGNWENWGKDTQFLSQYLQQRQDFTAQIATEWPGWTYPAWLMKDLMRWFLSQKHLLNYIASSEDLGAHFYKDNQQEKPDIRFHVFRSCETIWDKLLWRQDVKKKINELPAEKGTGIQPGEHAIESICPVRRGNKKCSSAEVSKHILLHTLKNKEYCCLDEDIQLAIPGGIVGYHAFYTILENVIRNGTKHSFTKMKKTWDGYIGFSDADIKNWSRVIKSLRDNEQICPRDRLRNDEGMNDEFKALIIAELNKILYPIQKPR